MESALHRTVEVLHQMNRDALEENIAPIFDSKALILDPQGICPPGHSHASLQDHSNRVLRRQALLWVRDATVKLLMRFWLEMKIVNNLIACIFSEGDDLQGADIT